jgi:GNAT superfamily N-acetyltransferase
MDVQRYGFLVATLGEDGAQALAKAAERWPPLAAVLVPRAIMAWLTVVDDFEGQLPGVDNTYLSFTKAEEAYTGTIAVGDTSYGFEAATPAHLAASIGISMGLDADDLDPALRDLDLQRLGKSIDLLVKARKAVYDLGKRQLDPNAGYGFNAVHHEGGFIGPQNTTTVSATHPSLPGENAGEATFSHNPDGKTITPEMSFVHPNHRRLGLASAIYAHAEKVTGKKVVPSQMQSEHAQGLWSGNAKRPQFGAGTPQKTQQPLQAMEKSVRLCVCGHGFASKHSHPPDFGCDVPGCKCTGASEGKALKAEVAGAAAPPQKQGAPMAPTAPQMQPKTNTVKTPKTPTGKAPAAAPKPPTVKLTMSQSRKPCPVCSMSQFTGERLTGCLCFADLAKNTKTQRTGDGFLVSFGPEWDGEQIGVFLEGLQGRARSRD